MIVPSEVALRKNCTLLIVAPALGVAVAVTVWSTPMVAVELLAGVVMETVGTDAAADTEMAVEVARLPLSSVACAVSE